MTGASVALEILQELDVVGASDTPDASDLVYVLARVNRILDLWSAKHGTSWYRTITAYTLVPSLQPHLIGPSAATWTVTQRPQRIDGARLVVGTTYTPLDQLSVERWMAIPDPLTTAAEPLAFYYEPTFPNGGVYFYPIPSSAYTVELLVRGLLTQLTLTGTVLLAPGYHDALVRTGAEACAKHFHATPPDRLEASKARGIIEAANAKKPTLSSDAPGCTTGWSSGIGFGGGGTGGGVGTGWVVGSWD